MPRSIELNWLVTQRHALVVTNALLLAFGVLLYPGCGGEPSTAHVAGTITLDGKPLAGASVTTQPVAANSQNPGSGSFGKTDDQGRFELELVTLAVKGAVIGEHRVMISPASSDKSTDQPPRSAEGVEYWTDDPNAHRAAADNKWPTHFTDGSLRLQVPPEGLTNVRFDLMRK